MAFASICGYDMMMLRGTAAYPLNGYLGHEGSGVVTAVGEMSAAFTLVTA